MNNVLLTRVTKYKYHGDSMNDDISDDDDLARQYRGMCAQDNALLKRFYILMQGAEQNCIASQCLCL